jgi:hypothetical protein
MATSMTVSPGTYPTLEAARIETPNRLWAVPILGMTVKSLLLIPVVIWLEVLLFVWGIVVLINSLAVLFTGSYMRSAYDLTLGVMRLNTKVSFYLAGLTDKYPGFGFSIDDAYALDIAFPEQPGRAFAIPIFGGLIRGILLIPFAIYSYVIIYGALLAAVVASVPVLFVGKYPESIFELVRDAVRLEMAELAYGVGLSDSYPSFSISTSHGAVKGVFIAGGVVLLLLNVVVNALSSGGGSR